MHKSDLSSAIKSARDIMRKNAGPCTDVNALGAATEELRSLAYAA
jgi:hypothetical protein